MRPSWQCWSLALTGSILLLASGCACNGEPSDTSPSIPEEKTLEESPDTVAPPEPEASAAEECLEMATREDWGAALDPCTRAARDHPDDEAIQRALEQAVSASEEAIE
jgi:hypothetical protein